MSSLDGHFPDPKWSEQRVAIGWGLSTSLEDMSNTHGGTFIVILDYQMV